MSRTNPIGASLPPIPMKYPVFLRGAKALATRAGRIVGDGQFAREAWRRHQARVLETRYRAARFETDAFIRSLGRPDFETFRERLRFYLWRIAFVFRSVLG